METLEALGWPLTLHVTEAAGHAYPGRVDTPLQEVFTQIQKWPKQRWILAHWGGGLPFFFINPRVRKFCANVWFDTAASLLLYDARIWSAVLNWVGPERIIFGSDYPLKLRPSLSAADGWVALRDQFLTEFGEAHLLQKVGMDNLTSLLQGSMKKS
jgi:predicted TIM-barrel fold metal-dependent hydrolase